MLNATTKPEAGSGLATATPSRTHTTDSAESRAMILAGMMLIGAISMQFAIFATVLIGGRGALVAIGAAVSWLTYEVWRIGGSVTILLATCVLAAFVCASLVALHRSQWIALPQRGFAWITRALGLSGSVALVLGIVQAA